MDLFLLWKYLIPLVSRRNVSIAHVTLIKHWPRGIVTAALSDLKPDIAETLGGSSSEGPQGVLSCSPLPCGLRAVSSAPPAVETAKASRAWPSQDKRILASAPRTGNLPGEALYSCVPSENLPKIPTYYLIISELLLRIQNAIRIKICGFFFFPFVCLRQGHPIAPDSLLLAM